MSPSEYSSLKVKNTPGELWRRKGRHWDRKMRSITKTATNEGQKQY